MHLVQHQEGVVEQLRRLSHAYSPPDGLRAWDPLEVTDALIGDVLRRARRADGRTTGRAPASAGDHVELGDRVGGQLQGRTGDVLTQVFSRRCPRNEQDIR